VNKEDEVGMEEYMNMGVKPLIAAFPEVGQILERYEIGCVPCTLGTCKLADVVKFHVLAPLDEAEMMFHIEKAIHPTRDVPRPKVRAAAGPPRPREISYSPPLRRLVDEHKRIKRLLALIPDVVSEIRTSTEIDSDLLLATVDFIRGYADRFHHMKEEDILFDYTDREAEIVQVIFEDHDRARGFVRAIVQALEDGDRIALCNNLVNYRELLTEHITKEDDILYPYIDRGLSTSQVGEIFQRFEEAESRMADDVPRRYEQFMLNLTDRYQKEETTQ
jgi:hemerythrin-like domain-containing protein